ncbi:MAG: hypothetical protein KGL39_25815 [Patescibacteria group bacterium]|nr:hypothetical protein [Patescibacteria group bacterium]
MDDDTDSRRVERIAKSPETATPDDVSFLVDMLKAAGNQRVKGLQEAAGLIRASVRRATVNPEIGRTVNTALLARVAGLVDAYAADAAAGKL